jgi:cell division protein ZapA
MAEVTITVNGKNYAISCEDGEEGHLHELAAQVDRKVHELRDAAGQAGEIRLMLMAGLLLADDCLGANQRIAALEKAFADLSKENESLLQRLTAAEEFALETLETSASRAEDIAARLGHA